MSNKRSFSKEIRSLCCTLFSSFRRSCSFILESCESFDKITLNLFSMAALEVRHSCVFVQGNHEKDKSICSTIG